MRLLGELAIIRNRSFAALLERAFHFFADGHQVVAFPTQTNGDVLIEEAVASDIADANKLDRDLLKIFVQQMILLSKNLAHGQECFGVSHFDIEIQEKTFNSNSFIVVDATRKLRKQRHSPWVKIYGHNPIGTSAIFAVPALTLMADFKLDHYSYLGYQHLFHVGKNIKPYCATQIKHQQKIGPTWHRHRDKTNRIFHQWVMQRHQDRAHKEVVAIVVVNKSQKEIMDWHEKTIAEESDYAISLSIVPGGMKGRLFLQHEGILPTAHSASDDEVADAIEKFSLTNTPGRPNPTLKKIWQKERESESGSRLTTDQVRMIRQLHADRVPIRRIMEKVGVSSRKRITRVLRGYTYQSVHGQTICSTTEFKKT